MPPIARRPGGRSARVRAAVLDAALAELRDVGFSRVTMEGIARRAGVNKTTLYRRWGDRERLLAEAMLERAEDRVPTPDTGSLAGDLLAFARAVAADSRSREAQAIVRAIAADPDPRPELLEASRRFWAERFRIDRRVVERAIARGEVRPEIDPQTVIEAVVGPIYFRVLVTRDQVDDAFVEQVVELAVAAVSPAAGRTSR